jgi:anhydro-N-acetylmuramic acid kinase
MTNRTMIVAGVMSGTSADGINVALVEMAESRHSRSRSASGAGARSLPFVRLIAHAEYPYPSRVRTAILSAMNASEASVAKLSRLNFLLGELYSEAVLATQKRYRTKIDLVGCHGQTLYHQGEGLPFLGRKLSTTWQTGEAAGIAARVRVPVVSDFRPADMAAGGKGAPLVPYLDYLWFRDPKIGRIVQNIGGIANLTALPGGASVHDVFAFDTGPGNMVIDALMQELFARKFDRDGKIAASGDVMEPVIQRILRRRFFQTKPPKTAGREEFGRGFVAEFLRTSKGARQQDIVATATALTARSISEAVRRFVIPRSAARNCFRELIVSGGGARNSTLVAMLAPELAALGIVVRFSDEFGLPSQAKEAVAFAVLAYETWHRRPSNVPSATGAKHAAILGKISYA